VPDTHQGSCFDNDGIIPCPSRGQPFWGQDAQFEGAGPSYRDNGDGTVSDLVTRLTWQKAHNAERLNQVDASAACESLRLGGHDDWRLPNVKELESIVDYRQRAPVLDERYLQLSDPRGLVLVVHHPRRQHPHGRLCLLRGLHLGAACGRTRRGRPAQRSEERQSRRLYLDRAAAGRGAYQQLRALRAFTGFLASAGAQSGASRSLLRRSSMASICWHTRLLAHACISS
jgi:Protein of unknown function (DUF1566)